MIRRKDHPAATLLACLAAILLFLPGCWVYSLNPFLEEEDAVVDEGLAGVWEKEGEKWTFTLEMGGDIDGFKIVREKGDAKYEYGAALFKLDGVMLANVFPYADSDFNWVDASYLPVHQALKYERDGGQLTLTLLSYEWVRDALQEKKVKIDHFTYQDDNDMTILTAPTKDLKKFLEKCLKYEEAWFKREAIVLTRVKESMDKNGPSKSDQGE